MTTPKFTVSPIAIAADLEGIDFPADKTKLVEHARGYGQGDETEQVIQVLARLPDRHYRDMADVEREVGTIL